MNKQFLYIVRTKAVFEQVKFNYFQIDTAYKIVHEFEPNTTKNAIYKSLDRARKEDYISQLYWNERNKIEGYKDLNINLKLKSIWLFTPQNIRLLLDNIEQDSGIKEEDYPMYAKIILGGDDIVGKRNLIIEEDR